MGVLAGGRRWREYAIWPGRVLAGGRLRAHARPRARYRSDPCRWRRVASG